MTRRFVPAASDRSTVRRSLSRIARVDVDAPPDAARAADALTQEISLLVGSYAAAFRPERIAAGWAFEFMVTRGFTDEQLRAYRRTAASAPQGMYLFDPARPERQQRNTLTTTTAADHERDAPAAHALFSRLGLDRAAQSRILLCDGPLLLSWVGVFFPEGPPSARDEWLVRALVLGARQTLRASRGFPQSLHAAALDAVLDAYPGEAFLVRQTGRIELANPVGAERLRDHPKAVLDSLGAALRDEPTDIVLRPVRGRGLPPLFLATRHPNLGSGLGVRLERARLAWRLTTRQTDVLRCLAEGDPNKDIAQRLSVSFRTVEVHVAAIMEKAKVESRSRLIARLWQGS